MEVFIVNDTKDLILSTIRLHNSEPIQSALSYITHFNYEPIPLARENYRSDQFFYKPDYQKMKRYIEYKERYLKVQKYSIDPIKDQCILEFLQID